uniref:Uncharacterized protein n=1 Tax=Kalanchoe fedtschenkoi TaxID=63787 RepID=A0A7N0VDK7_KALFE
MIAPVVIRTAADLWLCLCPCQPDSTGARYSHRITGSAVPRNQQVKKIHTGAGMGPRTEQKKDICSWTRMEGTGSGGGRKNKRKTGCNTRTSQEVTHPSTTLAQGSLTAEF